jgi:hypothetical protein
VNTLFDLSGGRMQYVYVLGDLLVTTIDVHLHAIDATRTKVDVTYVRTALRPEANEHVSSMGSTTKNRGRCGRKRSIVICRDEWLLNSRSPSWWWPLELSLRTVWLLC